MSGLVNLSLDYLSCKQVPLLVTAGCNCGVRAHPCLYLLCANQEIFFFFFLGGFVFVFFFVLAGGGGGGFGWFVRDALPVTLSFL